MAVIREFDKTKKYPDEIEKMLQELTKICKREGIPFFFAACVANNKKESVYKVEMLSAETCDTKLTTDWLCKFVDITLGFDAVPPTTTLEIDADMDF